MIASYRRKSECSGRDDETRLSYKNMKILNRRIIGINVMELLEWFSLTLTIISE